MADQNCPLCSGPGRKATEYGTGRSVVVACDECYDAMNREAAAWSDAKYGTTNPEEVSQ